MEQSTRRNGNLVFIFLLLFLSLLAAFFVAICTSIAPWGYSDSAAYFAAARNLAKGIGLGFVDINGQFSQLSIHAPLYSVVLSAFALLNIDLILASRWLNIISYFILVFSSGWLFYRLSKSYWAGLLFSVVISTSAVLTINFFSMMSEPLAFVTGVPGFLLLLLSLKENSLVHLIWAGVLCALAVLSRYAFIAIPIAGVIAILALSETKIFGRIKNAVLFSSLSMGPTAIWIFLAKSNSQAIGGKQFIFTYAVLDQVKVFLKSIYEVEKYWVPYRTNMIPGLKASLFSPILLLFFLLTLAIGIILVFNKKAKGIQLIVLGSLIFFITYMLVVFISFTFSSQSIPLNERLLSPLFISVIACLLGTACIVDSMIFPKIKFPFLSAILCLFFIVYNFPLLQEQYTLRNYPAGYTSSMWRNRSVYAVINALPAQIPILSNAPDVILFYTNRSAYLLTEMSTTSDKEAEYIRSLVDNQCGVFVLFDSTEAGVIENKSYLISQSEIQNLKHQYIEIFTSGDDVILQSSNCYKP